MYLNRFKNFAPACLLALLLAGPLASVAPAVATPLASLTRASAS
jgi:hypothetical protein